MVTNLIVFLFLFFCAMLAVMPVSDFCYIYDYKAKAYTPITFQSSGAGPRAGKIDSTLYIYQKICY